MPTSFWNSRLGHFFLQTLAWFLLLLLTSILAPFLLLLTLYRLVVDRVVFARQWLTRESDANGSIVSPILGLDVGFVNDDFYHEPKGAIGFVSVFDGPLDPARVEESVTKLLTYKNPNLQLNYDRLSSLVPMTAFGYPYWRRTPADAPFNAKNHVRVLNSPEPLGSGTVELNAIISKWIEAPFKEGCPLWDILLIPHPYEPYQCAQPSQTTQTVFAVRIHHLIGDGYSLREFMENLFAVENGDTGDTAGKSPAPPLPNGPLQQHVSTRLRFEFISGAPMTFFKFVYDFFIYRDFRVTDPKLCQTNQIYATTSCSLVELKRIRTTVQDLLRSEDPSSPGVNFSFSSLILYLFGNALARFWAERGRIDADTGVRVSPLSLSSPSHIKIASSLPIDDEAHPPGVMCNHWSHAIFEMPCHSVSVNVDVTPEDPLATLRTLARNHRSVLATGLPRIHTAITRHHHILPNPVWRAMASLQIGTAVGFVNLPGPGTGLEFCGARLVQVTPIAGRQWKHAGMTIAAYSYNGVLSIGMLACRDVIKEPAQGSLLLEQYFQDELQKLKDFLSKENDHRTQNTGT